MIHQTTNPNACIPGEAQMWHECILQHFRDLFIDSSISCKRKLKLDAKIFLLRKNDQFDFICNLLGYNAPSLRGKIRNIYYSTKKRKIPVTRATSFLSKLLIETYISLNSFKDAAS